ncbi:MAG: DUF2442 domain-containing protein [Methylococcaceae bacterium]
MIKIIQAQYLTEKVLRLHFSDNTYGDYDCQPLIDRQTELTLPLANESYFKQFFLELGALCWCNGLELSPSNIHKRLAESNRLLTNKEAA